MLHPTRSLPFGSSHTSRAQSARTHEERRLQPRRKTFIAKPRVLLVWSHNLRDWINRRNVIVNANMNWTLVTPGRERLHDLREGHVRIACPLWKESRPDVLKRGPIVEMNIRVFFVFV